MCRAERGGPPQPPQQGEATYLWTKYFPLQTELKSPTYFYDSANANPCAKANKLFLGILELIKPSLLIHVLENFYFTRSYPFCGNLTKIDGISSREREIGQCESRVSLRNVSDCSVSTYLLWAKSYT